MLTRSIYPNQLPETDLDSYATPRMIEQCLVERDYLRYISFSCYIHGDQSIATTSDN